MHHRVNNTLQLVISFVDIKGSLYSDASSKRALEQIANRIRGIAQVYDRIYAAPDVTRIGLHAAVRSIVSEAIQSHRGMKELRVVDRMDEIWVDVSTAIPLVIVVSEILANVFTHAFPQGEARTLTIAGSATERGFVIDIGDSGVGFPKDSEPPLRSLQIVHAVCKQIGADLTISSSNGTTCRIAKTR